MVLFLLLIIAAIALGIIGAVIKGFLYLLIIGIVVFLAALSCSVPAHGDGGQPAKLPAQGAGRSAEGEPRVAVYGCLRLPASGYTADEATDRAARWNDLGSAAE